MNRSKIMFTAWEYFKTGLFSSFGEAQRQAWQTARLKSAFQGGLVKVEFIKANGTSSTKTGTLSSAIMPEYKSKGTGRKASCGQIVFYSVDDAAFRSLRIERLKDFKTVQAA